LLSAALACSALRQEQIETGFEIECCSILEGDIVEAAHIFTCGSAMGCCLATGDDFSLRLDSECAKLAVIEKDDLTIVVGNEIASVGAVRTGADLSAISLVPTPVRSRTRSARLGRLSAGLAFNVRSLLATMDQS